jgi:hypothetical protein
MPQLDKFSFFTQIFWLFVLFFIFYYILVNIFLPNLSSLLKIRYKKLSRLKQELVDYFNIELNLFKMKKNHILNLLSLLSTSAFHYNFLLGRYNIGVITKVKRVKYKNKPDYELIYKFLKKYFSY